MSRDGAEAVRAMVREADEVRPASISALALDARRVEQAPQYISSEIYQMDANGLFWGAKSKGDDQEPISIFISGAFEIPGRVRDRNGEGWARLLRWADDDNRTHTYAVSDGDLHGDIST